MTAIRMQKQMAMGTMTSSSGKSGLAASGIKQPASKQSTIKKTTKAPAMKGMKK